MSFRNHVGVIDLAEEDHRDEIPSHHTIMRLLVPKLITSEHNPFLVNSTLVLILSTCGTKLLFSLCLLY